MTDLCNLDQAKADSVAEAKDAAAAAASIAAAKTAGAASIAAAKAGIASPVVDKEPHEELKTIYGKKNEYFRMDNK